MGKKYASIHIFAEDYDVTIAKLLEYFSGKTTYDDKLLKAAQIVGNAEILRFTKRHIDIAPNSVLVLQSQKLISVYDPALSFETVEEKALALSYELIDPIVYISNFDDDVLTFGVFSSGKQIASGTIGDGLSAYGLTSAIINSSEFLNCINRFDSETSRILGMSQDIDVIEEEFEKLLNVPLSLKNEDISSYINPYEMIRDEAGLSIFRKI